MNSLNEAKRSDKACCWSITINNPTDEDNTQWSSLSALPWVREVSGQVERGENGTLHIQGMLKTQSVRFAQVKKALPRAHIEIAKSPSALAKYVVKEDTRVSSIPIVKTATLVDVQEMALTVAIQYCYRIASPQLDPLDIDDLELIQQYSFEIARDWEKILDDTVNILIWQGFYGIEFVVSNPQIRTAFRKYFPAILYRTLNGKRKKQATPTTEEASTA